MNEAAKIVLSHSGEGGYINANFDPEAEELIGRLSPPMRARPLPLTRLATETRTENACKRQNKLAPMTDHHSDPSRNSDDSIEAAMRALKKSERTTEEKVGDESGAEQGQTTPEPGIDPVDRALKWMQERVAKSPGGKLAALADVFWNNWARPVTRFVNPLLRWVGNIYRWCFAKFAYRRDESGARIIAKNAPRF